jgi:hypothetical protein
MFFYRAIIDDGLRKAVCSAISAVRKKENIMKGGICSVIIVNETKLTITTMQNNVTWAKGV